MVCVTVREIQLAGIGEEMASHNRKTAPGGNSGAPGVIRRRLRATGWAVALLIGMLDAAPVSAQVMDCYALWGADGIGRNQRESWGDWTAADGAVTTETPCELYQPASDNLSAEFGVEIKIYLPAGFEDNPNPEAPLDTAELIAEALGDSLRTTKPRFAPFKITAALLQNVPRVLDENGEATEEFDWDTMAEATGSRNSGCRISAYVTTIVTRWASGGVEGVSAEDVKATLAHEIFHCYQAKYFNAQLNGAEGQDEDGWWVEGTAEFFADMVYPCASSIASSASGYVAEDRLNLRDDPYSTVTFYMHLANKHGFGLSALADFMGSMATSAGFQAQHDALAALPDIAAKFHDFGKAFTDADIPCAGAVVGFQPDPTPVTVGVGVEISLSQAPFRLKQAIAVVGKGEQYRARLVSPPGGGAGERTTSYRLVGESGSESWAALPEDFLLSGGCDGEKKYVFLSTVYGTDNTVLDAKLVFEGLISDIPFEQTCGECPVGIWRRDIGHLNAAIRRKVDLGYYSGFMDMWLTRNGIARVEYSGFVFQKGDFHSSWNGVTSGTWEHVGLFGLPGAEVDVRTKRRDVLSEVEENRKDLENLEGKEKAVLIRWTAKGVTKTQPHPGYELAMRYGLTPVPDPVIVTEGQRGPHAPSGRKFYHCKRDNQLYIGGGFYWRMN